MRLLRHGAVQLGYKLIRGLAGRAGSRSLPTTSSRGLTILFLWNVLRCCARDAMLILGRFRRRSATDCSLLHELGGVERRTDRRSSQVI